jgi:hypothetical protein
MTRPQPLSPDATIHAATLCACRIIAVLHEAGGRIDAARLSEAAWLVVGTLYPSVDAAKQRRIVGEALKTLEEMAG